MFEKIWKKLEENGFKISTDTRTDLAGTVFFAIKGENFDGNTFAREAVKKGAIAAVTDNPKNKGRNIYVVEDCLKTLQKMARMYREKFTIPVIVIGGSNGKTTSKDLLAKVLSTQYKVATTQGSFNNHLGVPMSVFSINKKTEMAVFEIGANHPGEHTELLDIIQPTHVVVTNNGMDHLEGFGSPAGARKANKEVYDWAKIHKVEAFVHTSHLDLLSDSRKITRSLYPSEKLQVTEEAPLTLKYKNKKYTTRLAGRYNLENIELAVALAWYFEIPAEKALNAICKYNPLSKRSQFMTKSGINFVVDCYNANPSSIKLALDSFVKSAKKPRGVVLGDMFELGKYSAKEHIKVVNSVSKQKLDVVVFVGERFKKALKGASFPHLWFPDSMSAGKWFWSQKFKKYTFLLKGSRGVKIEKILDK